MQSMPTVHLVPQSHIDIVWLWRYDPETIHRCCRPTFGRALDNLARFPDYVFCQSQVPLYEPMARVYPHLFDQMRTHIREGRWEIVGGMYVEAEGGEPCGEALVRQCVMGKRYFRETFGMDVTTGWQEDAWSHPWQLPQILRLSGMDCYMFRRGAKGETLFWWQSPDGSRVLACRPFTSDPRPMWREALQSIQNRYGLGHVMFKVGGGDHGGGLGADEIDDMKRLANELRPEVILKFSTFREYVDAVEHERAALPVVNDELGFELQGDLTNCGEIKKSNKECEILLLNAEKWSSIAWLQGGLTYPYEELEEAWRKLLFNQFHDILGGSLIPSAAEDTMGYYRSVRESCGHAIDAALGSLARNVATQGQGLPLIVFNPLPWDRTDAVETWIELDQDFAHLGLCDAQGRITPIQVLKREENQGKRRIRCAFVAQDAPSLGYRAYHVLTDPGVAESQSSPPLSVTATALENAFLRIEVDEDSGYLRRVWDKQNDREILASSSLGNVLVAIEDEGDSEGRFVLGSDTIGRPPGKATPVLSKPTIGVIEEGPVCAALRVTRSYQNSVFTQDIRLYAGTARVDFELRIDWHDVHRMIKVAFPTAFDRPQVTYDGPYAAIARAADGLEYPAQKWVDLCADGYGVALMNNARYAHDVDQSTVRLSVLRSPTEPAFNTDEGIHTIRYALYPHRGEWEQAEVLKEGYAFNYPFACVCETGHDGTLPIEKSFFRVHPANVLLEVVKKAYDSESTVLRLCEMYGRACTVEVEMPVPIGAAYETDLLENVTAPIQVSGKGLAFSIAPHQIKTIKVER
ncbi:MAG TPA: glycoside hydrolase family 38 C-terminal domain-containing protein [Candidatus Hydrogenedentes bacterium]|nr:glycoside hydrolase family 38 C-terminal domain-containing protein [Candidatus Hydrogenedentota bacterium]HPG68165.1 glycoside hydrolase family 38 C-terminal domain-containing protein [Candidatus Hydrogenedentota bacterium]